MRNASIQLHPEPQLETSPCPLCGEFDGTPIAERVRGEHALRTQSCHECGTVYQANPWTTERLTLEYEAEFAGETAELVLPIPGGSLPATDPQFELVKKTLLSGRANNAIALGYTQPGDRVLELGCGGGQTLALQREAMGIDAMGVEVCPVFTAEADDNRVTTELMTLDHPDWTFDQLDQIQAFHFLQRVPDPLAWLTKCWSSLEVGGRIVIEVPNLYHPRGSLESTFFRPTYLHTWSESTLSALLSRAGFVVERVVSTLTLFAVGRKASTFQSIVPYSSTLLTQPEHNHDWISSRLKTYQAMESTRSRIQREGPSMDAMHRLVHQLMQPAFAFHVVDVTLGLVDFFLSHRAVGLACLVATAASEGPYEVELKARLAKLATVIREEGVAAVGLESEKPAPLPDQNLSRFTDKEDQAQAERHTSSQPVQVRSQTRIAVEALMEEIRGEFQSHMALQLQSRPPFRAGLTTVAQA